MEAVYLFEFQEQLIIDDFLIKFQDQFMIDDF